MHALFGSIAERDRPALVFVDYHGHRRDYTYGEVDDLVRRYAAVLRDAGVARGDGVAVCTGGTARCIFVLLALERLGATEIACGETLTPDELVRTLHVPLAAFVTDRRRRPALEWVQSFLPDVPQWFTIGEEADGWKRLDTAASEAQCSNGLRTADAGAPDARLGAIAQVLACEPSDRVWSRVPFGEPQWRALTFAPLAAGATVIAAERQLQPRECAEVLYEVDATVLCQHANEYEAFLDAGLPKNTWRLPHLRRCVALEGDAVLAQRWLAATGKALDAAPGRYGMLPEPK